MAHVLVFETDPVSSELLDSALTLQGIPHFSCLVSLGEGTTLPYGEYVRNILEEHHPMLLITSWRHIGLAVRMVERAMTEPRPVEKWIVSGYQPAVLEGCGAFSWASEFLSKPISPLYFAVAVKRCLRHIPPSLVLR